MQIYRQINVLGNVALTLRAGDSFVKEMVFPAMKAVARAAFPRQAFLIVVIEREEAGDSRGARRGNVIYWFIHLALKGSDEVSFKIYDFT